MTLATCASAETNIGVSVNIGNAPPPPVVVVREKPRTVYVSEAHVYVVDDRNWRDDCFKVGAYWYVWHESFWYRASSWRGPFRAVETRSVPVAIHRVPERRWKHHPHDMPPGLAKKQHHDDRDHEVASNRHGHKGH
jgi:hypothetical protein